LSGGWLHLIMFEIRETQTNSLPAVAIPTEINLFTYFFNTQTILNETSNPQNEKD